MRYKTSETNLGKYYFEFIDAAIKHGEATLCPDAKVANKHYATLHRIYKYFQNHLDLASAFYSSLYDHEDASVRTWAGAHSLALKINIAIAETMLDDISKEKSYGILSLNAQYTLANWKKRGYLIL
jgi:hypothetical protein